MPHGMTAIQWVGDFAARATQLTELARAAAVDTNSTVALKVSV
jgi:hypothetical protein